MIIFNIIVHHGSMNLTTDSDGLFFNQTYITTDVLGVDTAKTPIASIKLVVDKNLTRNGILRFQHYAAVYPMFNNYLYYYSYRPIYLQVVINEQIVKPFQNLYMKLNFSNTTECSNGTHTFVSVTVNTYIMNTTGEFYMYLSTRIENQLTGYKTFVVIPRIDNGNFVQSLLQSII